MCHVLVIEDDPLIADYIVQLVEDAGATSVSQAVTEQEAVDEARRQRPALIMSDVKLIEGTRTLAVLVELGPIPVIFVTGMPKDCEPCNAPAVILGKPINEREVVHYLRRRAPI